MNRKMVYTRFTALLITFCFLLSLIVPFIPSGKVEAEEQQTVSLNVYTPDELAQKAVQFIYQAYRKGGALNAYDAFVLTLAGADLSTSTWVYEGKSIKDSVINSAYNSVKDPSSLTAKDIAYQLLAVQQWGYKELANQLAEILKARHGQNGFDNNVYSDMPAYDALGRAGQMGVINPDHARNYILKTQCTTAGDAYGSWGATWGGTFYPDFMTTAQAIRSLAWLPNAAGDPQIQAAINAGLFWMQKQQQVDGSVYTTIPWPDDPVIDTAETILTLKTLGIDPATWVKEGKSPVDYMLSGALNDDGSFGAYRNIMDSTWALYIYSCILGGSIAPDTTLELSISPFTATVSIGNTEQYKAIIVYFNGKSMDVTGEATWSVGDSTIASVDRGLVTGLKAGQTVVTATYGGMTGTARLTVTSPGGGSSDSCLVYIAVVGMNGELLYGPSSVLVSKTGKWGMTAMGALAATGLHYEDTDGFVTSIEGQANTGLKGWMYKVNDTIPPVLARDYPVRNGDRVIWWYSNDMNSPGPTWQDLSRRPASTTPQETVIPAKLQEQNKLLPLSLQASTEAFTKLEEIGQLLGLKEKAALDLTDEVTMAVAVAGSDKPMSRAEMVALKEELAKNKIELSQKVTAEKGAVITDANGELAFIIPGEKALKSDLEISIKKIPFASTRTAESNGLQAPVPAGYRQISAVYHFGPEGTTFDKEATLYLRVVIPLLVKPENLALAWYDKTSKQWKAIPAVVDVSRGLILAKIHHFSAFAIFARETKLSFTDVNPDSFGWAKDAVETLAGAGIVTGVGEARFEPSRPVTRAEFTSLLVRILGLEGKDIQNPFKDVKDSNWYARTITAAADAGLVKGYKDSSFRPDNSITREEVTAMLVRALSLPETKEELSFKDSNNVSFWARKDVATAGVNGLIKGFPDGTFRPRAQASRAEAAVMIYRMIRVLESGGISIQ